MTYRMVVSMAIVIISINYLEAQDVREKPENVYLNVSFVVVKPQAEFSRNVTNNGYGVDFDGGWYIYNGPLGLGFNLIAAQYGNFSRKIPYSYYVDMVSLYEATKSTIFIINPYIKPTIRLGDYSFHAKFFAGYQLLETNTTIKNDEQANNQLDEDEPDYIAKSNVASDGAFDYGVGLGLRFPIFRNLEKGPIFLSLEMKWSKGGEAEYLNASKVGAIEVSNPDDGPVTTTLNPDRSKTDLFNLSLGIGF